MKLRDVLEDALANRRTCRAIFCGMTGNVDIVIPFRGDDFLAAQRQFASDPADTAAPPNPSLADTRQALDYAAWFMARGIGGEADIPSIRPLTPLIDTSPHFRAVGGTGAQAANWLAGAGFDKTVLYLPFVSPDFDGLLHPGMKIIDNNAGYADLMREDPTFSEVHCIIDYAKGTRLRYGGLTFETTGDDRVILSSDRCNSRLRIAREFHDEACRAHTDSSLLVTGFNLCRSLDDFHAFAGQCVELMRDYHAANPGGFVHFEDCFQWDQAPRRRAALAETIWTRVDSLGMNEVEYRELCDLFGLDAADVHASLLEMAHRHGLRRVCLHTSAVCRVVTRYPHLDETRAIGLAILFSGARAFYGDFVELDKLAQLIIATRSISENAVVPDPVPLADGYAGLEVPTLKGMPVKSSIGLGDAFTAGLLAYL